LDEYPELPVHCVSLATSGKQQRVLDAYLAKWKDIRPTITGHDLKALGLEPGPAYRKILGDLRAAWIDGLIKDTDDERDRLRDLLGKDTRAPAKRRKPQSARKGVTKAA
jgi:tRNA nucleotidyltransferase (CCA-adding enzyme)